MVYRRSPISVTSSGGGSGGVPDDGSVTNAKVASGAAIDLDKTADSATRLALTATQSTKLAGIATGATANDTDANLKARANHTGTQSADTLTDGTTNKAFSATERTKLAGIATAATANDTDANLLARANHTGTQLSTTISDFTEAAQDAIAALLTAGTNVTLTYDDASNTLTIATGGVPLSTVDAKGDLLAGTADNTVARVAAGANGRVLSADSTQTAGVRWAYPLYGQTPRTGAYITPLGMPITVAAPTQSSLRAIPITLNAAGTADRIGVEVTTLAASTTILLAIYNHDDATGYPSSLLLDAGSVDSSTTGFKEITISQALSAGTYWLAAISIGGTPTVRAFDSATTPLITAMAQAELSTPPAGVVHASQTSFPSPFAATGGVARIHRVYLRFA